MSNHVHKIYDWMRDYNIEDCSCCHCVKLYINIVSNKERQGHMYQGWGSLVWCTHIGEHQFFCKIH